MGQPRTSTDILYSSYQNVGKVNPHARTESVPASGKRIPIASELVEKRLEEIGTNAFAAAERVGFERTYISDLVLGRKKSVNRRMLHRLSIALECDPAYLSGERETPGMPPMDPEIPPLMPARMPEIMIAGEIERGVFRTREAERSGTLAMVAPDRRYLGAQQEAYRVGCASYENLGLPMGCTLVSVEPRGFSKAHDGIPEGRMVIVQREIEGIDGRGLDIMRIGPGPSLVDVGTGAEADLEEGVVASMGNQKISVLGVVTRIIQVL